MRRVWVLKKDGSRQRYRVGPGWAKRTGRFYDRALRVWRHLLEAPPPPSPTPKLYRLTVALNYVIHHHYYSFVIQAWSLNKDELTKMIDDLSKKVWERVVAKMGGYSDGELWGRGYIYQGDELMYPSIEEPAEVEYDKSLIGKVVEHDEDLGRKHRVGRNKWGGETWV